MSVPAFRDRSDRPSDTPTRKGPRATVKRSSPTRDRQRCPTPDRATLHTRTLHPRDVARPRIAADVARRIPPSDAPATAAETRLSDNAARGAARGAPPKEQVPGDLERQATEASQCQADFDRAHEIYVTMAADRRLSQERIRAIWAEVQTEVFRIWQEVMLRREKVMNDLLDKWSKVLFS